MSKNYFSIRVDRDNQKLISHLKEKFSANIKVLSNNILYAQVDCDDKTFQNYINKIDEKGYKILEVKKIMGKDDKAEEDDFELIDKNDCEDSIYVMERSDVNIFDYIIDNNNENSNKKLEKKKAISKDAFSILISKEYLVRFIFFSMVLIYLIKLIELLQNK